MTTFKALAGAGLIAAGLALASPAVQAQTATPVAPAAAPTAAVSGFDGYRVLAVTAGVLVGATVAAVVTDGLIVPAYLYAAGGHMGGGMSLAGGMAAGAGAGAGEVAVSSGVGQSMYGAVGHAGYQVLRTTMTVLGAIGGGFYADSWYMGG